MGPADGTCGGGGFVYGAPAHRAGHHLAIAQWGFDLGGGGWGIRGLEGYANMPGDFWLDGRGHLAIRATKVDPAEIYAGAPENEGPLRCTVR
jgi:hypothetical protein